MKKELIDLGTFEVISGTLRISDPCYDKDTWCAGAIDNVLNGTWKTQVLKKEESNWGSRCRKLVAVHSTFNKEQCTVKKLNIDVGVDSGCAGIFDDTLYGIDFKTEQPLLGHQEYDQRQLDHRFKELSSLYKNIIKKIDKIGKSTDSYPFLLDLEDMKQPTKATLSYDKNWRTVVSDVTFSNVGAGVVRNGVCSSSGFGDGSYAAYAAYNSDGKVVGIKILF